MKRSSAIALLCSGKSRPVIPSVTPKDLYSSDRKSSNERNLRWRGPLVLPLTVTPVPIVICLLSETYSLGASVELGKIDRELKKLWEQGEGAMTRASLVNLAVYSEQPGSLEKNTQLIAKITENHACRAIVIGADCKAKENRVEAWISAHCHVSRAGSKQVCSEQISFLLQGPCTTLLPSIVFSHLDSDLPFYLWWQEEFSEPMDPQLWAWVDRVIYDSQGWKDFRAQLHLVRDRSAGSQAADRALRFELDAAG